jgi:hypothetical protein
MIVDPDFCDHWKTRMLVGTLDGDECAPLYVLRLWAHCQNRRQSTFENISPEALKALCRFPGNANKLEASLVTSGFVRREGKVLIVVGWDEYNSSLIAAWNNGAKGGRPPKFKPESNPEKTQEKPTGKPLGRNPGVCDKIREDKSIEREREGEIGFKLDDYPGVTLLQSGQFQEAWGRWEAKHRHIRSRSMDFTQRAALLQKLQTNTTSVDDAISLIDHCLAHCDNLHFDGRHRDAVVGLGTVGAVVGGSRPARKTKGQLAMEAMGL